LIALSALDGATLFRIPRDNAYIAHMLKLLKFFYETYCMTGQEPPENFFSLHNHNQHYAAFFESTLRIARTAECIARIPQEQVQRSPLNNVFFVN